MREPIRYLGENSRLPISCIPNAGLPLNIDGQAVYPLEPEPFADTLFEFASKNGVSVVGGCCGTTPDHLKLLVEKVASLTPAQRAVNLPPRLSSAIQSQPMKQEPAPFFYRGKAEHTGQPRF